MWLNAVLREGSYRNDKGLTRLHARPAVAVGEVDGHEGVAVVLHVVVHAETGPVVSINVANCGRGGEGSVSCRGRGNRKG